MTVKNKKRKLKIWCEYCQKFVFIEKNDIFIDDNKKKKCDCPECGYELINSDIK